MASGFGSPKPRFVGRGLALGERPAAGGTATAELTLSPDGSVLITTPTLEQGTGTHTILRQVVAEELHVGAEMIAVQAWPTGAVRQDNGIAGSRGTRVSTGVAYAVCEAAKQALVQVAGEQLCAPSDTLSFVDRGMLKEDSSDALTWQELLRRSGRSVTVRAEFNAGSSLAHVTSFAAQVAEVEVDPETGEVKLLGFTSAHDTGVIVDPAGHQGQINGSVVQGIGYATMEELLLSDGAVTNLSFGDYKIPTSRDVPELRTPLVTSSAGHEPYDVKAIGEVPISPVAAAIANAVEDAVGVRIRELPITAEKVYRALRVRPRD
jgi:CO/xanthine dehydrogenase Mo-binding subunit